MPEDASLTSHDTALSMYWSIQQASIRLDFSATASDTWYVRRHTTPTKLMWTYPGIGVSKTAYRTSDSAGCACVAAQMLLPAPVLQV